MRKDKAHTAEYHRDWYARNREARIVQIRASDARIRERLRAFVWEYLSAHPCIDCGETDPVVLEFDHVRGSKVESVALLLRKGATLKMMVEIEKCEIRCANCHRRATSTRAGGWRTLMTV